MSIATYAELTAAIQSWMEDSSGAHASQHENFVQLGELLLTRKLRIREMVTATTGTLTAADPLLALPTRFAGMTRFEVNYGGGRHALSEVAVEKAIEHYGFSDNSLPKVYSIEGDNIRLWPTPDSDYSYAMTFRQKPEPINSSNTTGWLLTKAPDAYLYAALVSAGLRIESPKTVGWATALQTILNDLEAESISDTSTDQSKMMNAGGTP